MQVFKTCRKCSAVKEISFFYKAKGCIDGHRQTCKECSQKKIAIYYQKNQDSIKQYRKENYFDNEVYKKDARARSSRWYENNQDKLQEYKSINKERITKNKKEYHYKNRENISKKVSEYYKKNPEKAKEKDLKNKKWREDNKEWVIERGKRYLRKRLKEEPLFKLKQAVRQRVYKSIKYRGYTKKSKTFEILDCTCEFFRSYIESKWQNWMNWDNYGKWNGELNYGWDLDHIIPISAAKTEEEVLKLNHYTNFQPLCSHVNRYIKVNKY